ncbi:MAG: TIGR01212 family radical SAM protein, partial [Muribaculaceae bacterium]|nr:TIGR01212 family radical SAM protein [Muribaculaceae bacterium]
MNGFYKDYADFLAEHFPGKMQKLAINAGLSCPNRDGTIGHGGCCYCVNSSFVPRYCHPTDSVTTQIDKGIQFFGKKYPQMRYLGYFQAYTNTNAGLKHLVDLYDEALNHPMVDGIIIGTRPDCMPQQLLSILGQWHHSGRWVMIEYGAETRRDDTLQRINRCHTWADVVNAVIRTHSAGIPVGLHLIAGLPGETLDDALESVDAAISLPIDTIKL